MQFSDLVLKAKYDSDEDDILHSFHVPLLSYAKQYDRAVGYFSSEVLASAAAGLEKFVQSKGKIRLIIGDPLTDDEYEAVLNGTKNKEAECSKKLTDLLLETHDKNLKILTYLIANKQLEIKFAFTHRGMFHKKIGIFYGDAQTVVFSGSANETLAGLSKYNSEEISAFFSWKSSFDEYGQSEIDYFNSLWLNTKKRTKVVSLSSRTYQKIQTSVDKEKLYRDILGESIYPSPNKNDSYELAESNSAQSSDIFFKYSFAKADHKVIHFEPENKVPSKPLVIKNKPFKLFPHQKSAIQSWINADYKGLFKLATGAGKTFTSISAMVDLYESRARLDKQTFVVVTVPYIELANQWLQELEPFNIVAVPCYESSDKWIKTLDKKILRFKSGGLDFVCVVVVNRTLVSENFQNRISKIPLDKMLLIGDECHHLGGQNLFENIPKCKYRIGLSATPFRMEDDEIEGNPFPDTAKENLIAYFGGIISEYTLSDAINDEVLSPYTYDLVPVYLTEEEQNIYEEYSERIQRMILKSRSSQLSSEERQNLTNICGLRSRLLATCQGKLPALIAYLSNHKNLQLTHSLIYVGEGKALDEEKKYVFNVTNRLHEYGIRVAKFTSDESNSERKRIMADFKDENIDALVAMKVLDEGIDVPVCKSAFILASTRNPRQYVQRRGRVLRKAIGKESALIVDFVVLPQKGVVNRFSQNLKNAELQRIEDFKFTASNTNAVEKRIIELGIM
ncbi:DEAD/DEAH box helicase family protein [Vibrio sp. JC009]|uniref:DEAD/DEAH box helicase family protein n=1 Tax=Vibrio sp. JC009 TaxID=2912314 RepID=UPI0023B020F9|nr:DEAD/DEAH box helicase family protein [Vibrio sp. JC009]WED22807.1 DEAD/DEAH box helicase family protein [Vibrio sp. JC009]